MFKNLVLFTEKHLLEQPYQEEIQLRCFPMNIQKILRTAFFIEHSGCFCTVTLFSNIACFNIFQFPIFFLLCSPIANSYRMACVFPSVLIFLRIFKRKNVTPIKRLYLPKRRRTWNEQKPLETSHIIVFFT